MSHRDHSIAFVTVSEMSNWRRFHLNGTVKATATSHQRRFFVQIREPRGEHRQPLEFYRWKLSDAQEAADKVVQAYYPHECDTNVCGTWRKSEG